MEEVKNVVEIKGITKDYGDFKLDNVTFAINGRFGMWLYRPERGR